MNGGATTPEQLPNGWRVHQFIFRQWNCRSIRAATAGIGIANPDAIQEFKIQTSHYDAGYGRKPGANVNVVTKSGTNEFHGTAFEFFRNTDLNANDFFRKISPPLNGVPNNGRQVLNQNQFGGVFGGPVKKDKLFFFASFQETWQKNGVSAAGYSAPTLVPIPTGDRSNTAAFRLLWEPCFARRARPVVRLRMAGCRSPATDRTSIRWPSIFSNSRTPMAAITFPAQAPGKTKTPPSVFPPCITSIRL